MQSKTTQSKQWTEPEKVSEYSSAKRRRKERQKKISVDIELYIWFKQTEIVQKKCSLENRMKETHIEDRLLDEELKRKFKRTEIKKLDSSQWICALGKSTVILNTKNKDVLDWASRTEKSNTRSKQLARKQFMGTVTSQDVAFSAIVHQAFRNQHHPCKNWAIWRLYWQARQSEKFLERSILESCLEHSGEKNLEGFMCKEQAPEIKILKIGKNY